MSETVITCPLFYIYQTWQSQSLTFFRNFRKIARFTSCRKETRQAEFWPLLGVGPAFATSLKLKIFISKKGTKMLLRFYRRISLHPNGGSHCSRLRTFFPQSCLRGPQAVFNDMSCGSTRRIRFFGVAVVASECEGCSHFLFSSIPARFTCKRGGCGVPRGILPPEGKDAPD